MALLQHGNQKVRFLAAPAAASDRLCPYVDYIARKEHIYQFAGLEVDFFGSGSGFLFLWKQIWERLCPYSVNRCGSIWKDYTVAVNTHGSENGGATENFHKRLPKETCIRSEISHGPTINAIKPKCIFPLTAQLTPFQGVLLLSISARKALRLTKINPNNLRTGCATDSGGSEDSYPEFSTEPLGPEETAVLFSAGCGYRFFIGAPYKVYDFVDTCMKKTNFSDPRVDRVRQVSLSIAEITAATLYIAPYGNRTSLTFNDLAPIRRQVIRFRVSVCSGSRPTKALALLRLTNLLEYVIERCNDLDVKKNDFQHSLKLRVILFSGVTIRTLETDTFTNLPALKVLSLERSTNEYDAFTEQQRDYLFSENTL
ncbi:uncharacterized protein LOC129589952 [Paramacrobiotus metropolitanus]|uniref:uncharacterized protein LOC129589952 n=1 Tax=Paramacrobiotus metropolitanus TaxID=2943436 RepID=UPI002445A918|nr:uncharacterized protein LOC129589952 [Paramacrobiotus metropolitanus]